MSELQLYREALIFLLASPSNGDCKQDILQLLGHLKQQRFGVYNVQQLLQYLQNCTKLFEIEMNGGNRISVLPRTSLTICRTHSKESGSCPEGTCMDLHFCVFFLLSGNCSYGDRCHFGHRLGTQHNYRLLQRHLLDGMNITQLRILFCLPAVRQGVMLPQVCRYFNRSDGCTKEPDCHSFHLCLHYILGQCKFARHCNRNHNINDPQVKKVLDLYGVKVRRKLSDILQDVRSFVQKHEEELYAEDQRPHQRPRPGVSAQPRRSDSVPNLFQGARVSLPPRHETRLRDPSTGRGPQNNPESAYTRMANTKSFKIEEICMHFLKGVCKFDENCQRLHSSNTFLWRVMSTEEPSGCEGSPEWRSLPADSNLTLEETYCQPHETHCIITDSVGDEVLVDLSRRTAWNTERTRELYKVRRVSTPSYMDPSMKASASGHLNTFGLATVWLWYWKSQNGVWFEFGTEEGGRLPVTSAFVEEKYQMNISSMTFDQFVLDFARMRLKVVGQDRKFKVRRRPQPLLQNGNNESYSTDSGNEEEEEDDKDDVARAPANISQNIRHSDAGTLDSPTSAVSSGNILFPIHPGSKKYMSLKRLFKRTLGTACTVLNIHSMDNPRLEDQYKRMKTLMEKDCGKRGIKERKLYYAPASNDDVTSVYTNGVNCDNEDVVLNGRERGKGDYFHVNAAQANKGVRRGMNEERHMFLMKCLIGPVAAPAPDGSFRGLNKGYECGVDDVLYPKTYIIFNHSQVCPKYMISYRLS